MKIFVSLFLVLLAIAPRSASALSRVWVPRNVAIAQADAIVVAQITTAPEDAELFGKNQSATVTIERAIKGELAPGETIVRLQPLHRMALGALEKGEKYLLFLQSTTPGNSPEIMFDGTKKWSESEEKAVADAFALTPAWSEPSDGVAALLTAEEFHVGAKEHLNLYFGVKNLSNAPILLKYRDWPLETHTFWDLKMVSPSAQPVMALPHPTVTAEEIADYFSRFPHSYEITLAPGQSYFYGLGRVNSALPGWGYKQELDFKFYPMTQSGAYEIEASANNWSDKKLPSAKVRVWIK